MSGGRGDVVVARVRTSVRARCAPLAAAWMGAVLTLLAHRAWADEGAQVLLDLSGDAAAVATALSAPDHDAAPALDALAERGLWLQPAGCAGQAPAGGALERAMDPLYAQDVPRLRAVARAALDAAVCGREVARPEAVAEAWYVQGVADVLEGGDGAAPFGAIHALAAPGFVAPDLGRKVRDAFDAAAAAPAPAARLDAPSPGAWHLDGSPIFEAGAALAPVPHVVQRVAPGGAVWGALLVPAGEGWRVAPVDAPADPLPATLQGALRGDVARWLRVSGASGAGAQALPSDARDALIATLGAGPWALTVRWQAPSGAQEAWTLRADELAPVPVEGVAVRPPDRRVSLSGSLGALGVRGALFLPASGDVAVRLGPKAAVEVGLGFGNDLGRQGPDPRWLLYGRAAARLTLRDVQGLTASVGGALVTRGPDPADPTVFVLEGYGGGWLRWRPRGVLPFDGPYVEAGAGLAPGLWRSTGTTSEGAGFMGWLSVGLERR